MNFCKTFLKLFSAIALTLAASNVAFGGGAAEPETEKWIQVRSPNFQFAGNASEPDIRRYAARLEQFRDAFTRLFPKMNFTSPVPTVVLVFKDEKSFAPFKPLDETGKTRFWVKGFFQPDRDRNYIAFAVERDNDFTTVYHEYVHYLLDNTLGKNKVPPWFGEGLAEYYEQFQIENDRRVVLGAVDKAYPSLLKKNALENFEKFFAVDYYTLRRQNKTEAAAYYAQAWAIVHYLFHGRKGARAPQIQRFIELLAAGIASKPAFEEAFQTNYAALETEVKKYLEQKDFQTSVSALGDGGVYKFDLQSAPLSSGEAKAFQGDLLARAGRFDEAENLLAAALFENENAAFANASLGLVKLKRGDFPAAKKYLKKSLSGAGARNYFVFYAYAYLLSREGMSDFGFISGYTAQTAEDIRENLRRAIELNPDFAESYQLFAFISAARNEYLDEGIEMIEKALRIAPGNEWYIMRRAELYLRKKQFSQARATVRKLLETASDDSFKLYALNTLAQINAWETQLREIEENRRRPASDAVTERVLTEDEINTLNARATLESLNLALRRPKTDEKRLLGLLSKVRCVGENTIYSVKIEDQLLNFRSVSVKDVFLTNYEPSLTRARFGCDQFPEGKLAVITFRPEQNTQNPTAGEITAIEFVPANFVFLDITKIKQRTEF